MKRWIATIVFCVVCAPAFLQAEIIDRIVARVNDDVVTLYDVRQAAIPYVLQQGMNPVVLDQPQRRGKLYKDVLEDLIDESCLCKRPPSSSFASPTLSSISGWRSPVSNRR